jgi:hypothetical protein
MQKVINLLAVISFVGVAGIYAGGTTLLLNKDIYIENAKNKLTEVIGEAIVEVLPTALDAELPQALPQTTGGAIPF